MAYHQSHHQNVFPPPVHFQIPSFVYSVAPTLAPGGGAEVLPVSLLADNQLANAWFSNNGFAPRSFNDQYQQQDDDNSSSYGPPTRQQTSVSAPFEFDSYIAPTPQSPPELQPLRSLTQAELSAFIRPQTNPAALLHAPPSDPPAPSSLGLPVYSASGFDLLSILARVANRPHPRVQLGPVDLTCSFVVVDVRRFDHPIVYCSPTFCHLTGYPEHEVIGRNCRFLQAPKGQVQRGELRHFTDQTAVAHLKKNLSADKECQTSIVNYKKDGTAFINLVTVIPILGGVSGLPHEESDVVYHVGFQVDLTEQPNAILEKLRDGSYLVDYAAHSRNQLSQPPYLGPLNVGHLKDRKSQAIPSARISRELKKLLADSAFVKSIPLTTSTTIPSSLPSSSARAETDSHPSITGHNQLLHLMLLETLPDFIHVVSLKGSFLYVAPSVRRVLGYEPHEMVGKSLSDYAHPEDVVPLMRELKEGSATGLATMTTPTTDDGGGGAGGGGGSVITTGPDQVSAPVVTGLQMAPRSVDLLFRARTKVGAYVWIECKGRLHVEPGKGRKAIILSGRAKEMPKLDWHSIARGGGLSLPVPKLEGGLENASDSVGRLRCVPEAEVWGTMSSGEGAGGVVSLLVIGSGMTDVLGWTPSELIGREVINLIVDGVHQFNEELRILRGVEGFSNPRRFCCKMRHKNGSTVDVVFIIYRSTNDSSTKDSIRGVISAPLIYQIRTLSSFKSSTFPATSFAHSLNSDVFQELDTIRDSSWQYEIQQVRFANQRLEEEIVTLSKQLEEAEDMQQKVYEELQQNTHEAATTLDQYISPKNSSPLHHQSPPSHFDFTQPPSSGHHQPYTTTTTQHHDLASPTSTSIHNYSTATVTSNYTCQPVTFSPLSPFSREWDNSAFIQQQQQNQPRMQNLKRSWDSVRR